MDASLEKAVRQRVRFAAEDLAAATAANQTEALQVAASVVLYARQELARKGIE